MSCQFCKLLAFTTPRPALSSPPPWTEFKQRLTYRESCKLLLVLSNSLKFTLKLS